LLRKLTSFKNGPDYWHTPYLPIFMDFSPCGISEKVVDELLWHFFVGIALTQQHTVKFSGELDPDLDPKCVLSMTIIIDTL